MDKIMDNDLENIKSLKDFENLALDSLDEEAKYYFCAGASTDSIPRANEKALRKYRIQPRVLRDVSKTSLSCDILNSMLPCPIGIAPTGFHFFAHKDAEIATALDWTMELVRHDQVSALGGMKENCIYIMSSVSSTTMEDVSNCLKNMSPKGTLWMQMYIFKDRSATLDLLKRAEASGFSAIVVTVDSPISGQWKTNLPGGFPSRTQNKYKNLPRPCYTLQDDTLTFDDLKWLKEQTKLPVIAKGILSGEDAIKAAQCGVDAIYVSNHAERQIYEVVPTIDVLEEVVEAVKQFQTDVYFDGGVRHGKDIFVAMALGAKAVFVGRPIIWGLTVAGEKGVRRVLEILKEELLSTMQLAGMKNITDINKAMIRTVK